MPRRSDSNARLTLAQFERLTGAGRDDWRKWCRRGLVSTTAGYTWPDLVDAIALRALEAAAGLDVVIQCWDDVREELGSNIRQPVLDLIVDPGISPGSRPRMRAFVSTSDGQTARLARAAVHPHVLPLAGVLASTRVEYERTLARAEAHADPGKGKSSNSRTAARHKQ